MVLMPATPRKFEFSPAQLEAAQRAKSFWSRLTTEDGEFLPRIGAGDDLVADRWDINVLQFQPEPVWLIENMVEENGLTIFFGPDKVGKTAMVSHFLWNYVAGKDYFLDPDFGMHDPTDRKRSVVYVLLEGVASFNSRYQAWADVYNDGQPIDGFDVVKDGLSLFEPKMKAEDPTTWTTSAVSLYNSLTEDPPAILVIDTLSRATAGMNENSPEMAQVVRWCDKIRDEMGIATIIVHHVALDKAESARPRGHSSLKGAASSYVHISGDPDSKVLYLKHGPHRNAESGSHGYGFVRQNHGNAFIIGRTHQTNQTIELSDRTRDLLRALRLRGGSAPSTELAKALWDENSEQTRKYLKRLVEGPASEYTQWYTPDGDGRKVSEVAITFDPEPELEEL